LPKKECEIDSEANAPSLLLHDLRPVLQHRLLLPIYSWDWDIFGMQRGQLFPMDGYKVHMKFFMEILTQKCDQMTISSLF
jgi:hypothetical protein